MIRAVVLAATLFASAVEARVMNEQFYIDHMGNRISRVLSASPITYDPSDQMFYFLGHFGYVEDQAQKVTPSCLFWFDWNYAFDYTQSFAVMTLPECPLFDHNPQLTINEVHPVSEPGALLLFVSMLGIFGALVLTARQTAT